MSDKEPTCDAEDVKIRRTDVEELQLNQTALTRIGNGWPDETAMFDEKLRSIMSTTSDQLEGGEEDRRTITITVFVNDGDMSPEQGD